MPRRDGDTMRMELLPMEERLKEPDRCQGYWYDLVARRVKGLSVVDVGAGTGYGLPILASGGASRVVGIDPLPAGPGIEKGLADALPDGSFDVAAAMDVIEHVEDDAMFLKQLLRIARKAVFLSTPNWDRFHCDNRFHFREYTADELTVLLAGHRTEAWCIDDQTTSHLPWRTPRPDARATNFGIWIWKEDPLRDRDEPRLDVWDGAPIGFLSDDRPNPARAAAAAMIADLAAKGVRSMVEVGPGPGFDYVDHFRGLPVSYVAYEPSATLRSVFLLSAPGADIRPGGYVDLPPESYDLCYTKATLEHQRDFRHALHRMLLAARRVLINWYLPPDEKGALRYSPEEGIWYNRYVRSEVIDFIHQHGYVVEERPQPPPGNSLWFASSII